MRTTVILIWCAILGVADWFLLQRATSPSEWTAKHDMFAGHLMGPGDLAPIPLEGRYLVKDVKKDHVISASDVTEALRPIVQQAGTVVVALPVARAFVTGGGVNARSKAQLCRSGQVSLSSVEVQSVICPPDSDQCNALVSIPSGETGLAAPDKPDSAVTVQKKGSTCP